MTILVLHFCTQQTVTLNDTNPSKYLSRVGYCNYFLPNINHNVTITAQKSSVFHRSGPETMENPLLLSSNRYISVYIGNIAEFRPY